MAEAVSEYYCCAAIRNISGTVDFEASAVPDLWRELAINCAREPCDTARSGLFRKRNGSSCSERKHVPITFSAEFFPQCDPIILQETPCKATRSRTW